MRKRGAGWRRSSKRSVYSPALETILQRADRETGDGGPFRKWAGHSLIGNPSDIGSIPGLYSVGRPAAIVRFVITVVVDAIDRMFSGRSRPHVRKERRVVVPPAIADRDSSSAVVQIPLVVGVVTATTHPLPRRVFDSLLLAERRVAMLAEFITGQFSLTTTAALCMTAPQMAGGHNRSGATVATTKPSRDVFRPRVEGGRHESPVALPDKVEYLGHATPLYPGIPWQGFTG